MHADLFTALGTSHYRLIYLYKMELLTGWVYYWNGYGQLTWDSHVWSGSGNVISISATEETDIVQATGVVVQLTGADSTLVEAVRNYVVFGKQGVCYFGLMDANGSLIGDPCAIFTGLVDRCEIVEQDPQKPTINIALENQMIQLERSAGWRYTHEHQILLHGDTSLKHMAALQDMDLQWGTNP